MHLMNFNNSHKPLQITDWTSYVCLEYNTSEGQVNAACQIKVCEGMSLMSLDGVSVTVLRDSYLASAYD